MTAQISSTSVSSLPSGQSSPSNPPLPDSTVNNHSRDNSLLVKAQASLNGHTHHHDKINSELNSTTTSSIVQTPSHNGHHSSPTTLTNDQSILLVEHAETPTLGPVNGVDFTDGKQHSTDDALAAAQSSSDQTATDSSNSTRPLTQPQQQLLPERPFIWRPRSIDVYRSDKLTLIGEGTYGSVFLAKDAAGKTVAMKKVRLQKHEGFPITAIREIKLLKSLKHDNLIPLLDVCSTHEYKKTVITKTNDDGSESHSTSTVFKEGDVFMVFPYMDHDLSGLLESGVALSDAQVKYYMKCMLSGLDYLHNTANVIHRDIKPANIFISNCGHVKIGDFGLGRKINKNGQYTNRVVTLWYRAPELLLGVSCYTVAIDMWALGCLFAELLTRGTVLFPGNNSDVDQLNKIYDVCGTPNEANWPGVSQLAAFQKFTPKHRARVLKMQFRNYSPQAVDLLDKLLTLDPRQRITAKQALQHHYFAVELPPPMLQSAHPIYTQHLHEYYSKRKRKHREMAEREKQEREKQQQHQVSQGEEPLKKRPAIQGTAVRQIAPGPTSFDKPVWQR